MPYVKIEPSGCCERHGFVQVRLAMYLEKGDYGYERTYIQVPVIPEGGYQGKVDAMGNPVNMDAYNTWLASLPKVWQLNPFHNHFLHLEPDVSDEKIQELMVFHLANFYEAWKADYGLKKGGMRHGWDVRHRKPPRRWDVVDPKNYLERKELCIARLASIKSSSKLLRTGKGGELFPATEIDIGAPAINRNTIFDARDTWVEESNPANETGTIDTIEIWAANDISDCEAATFIHEGSNVFSTRDTELLGLVPAGSKQTFSGLDCDVTAGDYIGAGGASDGDIEADSTGGTGIWFGSGDKIPCSSVTFTHYASYIMSLYGTGETSAILQTVGEGAITPTGTLGLNIKISMGSGSITPTGLLNLKTLLSVGLGNISPAGALNRLIKLATGAGSISPSGAVSAALTFFQSVGQGAITPSGALSTILRFIQSVGQGAITPAGALNRLIKIATGAGSITSTGALSTLRKIFQTIGQGAVTPTGSILIKFKMKVGGGSITPSSILSSILKLTQSVGQGAITPTGALNRLIKIVTGAGSVTSSGALSTIRKIFQTIGQGAISPSGSVLIKFMLSVGGGSITPTGVLTAGLVHMVSLLLRVLGYRTLKVEVRPYRNLLVKVRD